MPAPVMSVPEQLLARPLRATIRSSGPNQQDRVGQGGHRPERHPKWHGASRPLAVKGTSLELYRDEGLIF